jgi:hypothetical protein
MSEPLSLSVGQSVSEGLVCWCVGASDEENGNEQNGLLFKIRLRLLQDPRFRILNKSQPNGSWSSTKR